MKSSTPHPDLLALLDRRLAPDEQARALVHLAGCPACQAEARELGAVHDSLAGLPGALRPWSRGAARLWPEVWRQVQPPLRVMRSAWRAAAGLAMVMLVLAASSARFPLGAGDFLAPTPLARPLPSAPARIDSPPAPRLTTGTPLPTQTPRPAATG